MTLYTRRYDECEIVAWFGEHQPSYLENPLTLVLIRLPGSLTDRFYWAEIMRADDGAPELFAAVDKAPKLSLSKTVLAAAFVEAE